MLVNFAAAKQYRRKEKPNNGDLHVSWLFEIFDENGVSSWSPRQPNQKIICLARSSWNSPLRQPHFCIFHQPVCRAFLCCRTPLRKQLLFSTNLIWAPRLWAQPPYGITEYCTSLRCCRQLTDRFSARSPFSQVTLSPGRSDALPD